MTEHPDRPRSRRARTLTSSEALLWREAMRDTTPFPGRAAAEFEPVAAPAIEKPSAPPARPSVPAEPHRRAVPASALRHGEVRGVDGRTAERLRRGRLPIEGRIDLHGLTQDEAFSALSAFLRRSHDQGRRCVLVITGKGLRMDGGVGVLRAAVPRWLNEPGLRERVLAFSHAQPRDGGEGALYVLLRRVREDRS